MIATAPRQRTPVRRRRRAPDARRRRRAPDARRRRGAPDVRRRLLAFVGVAVFALLVIGVATVVLARQISQQDALRDAERTTSRLADLVVAPLLNDVLAGNAAQRDALDRAVHIRLSDGTVDEIIVWRGDGTVVYTDWTPAIGKRFDVPALALDAINRGQTASDLDVGDEIGHLSLETRYVEVYVPLRLPGQPSMAFEAYYNSERVGERQAALTMELVLLGLLPLVLLQLVQIPIAVSLAGSVARQESERAALLERALSASERERRTIASDLHDGVVQDLAGVSYALGALTPIVPPDRRGIADSCAASVQSAVETLRRLIVDIYPPDLTGSGLAAAIDDLARPLRESGATVTIASEALPEMKPDAAAAIYRVARETLANVAKHSHASSIDIELGPVHDGSAVRLCVADDGVGLAPGALDRRTDGHFGLPMLRDRMADLGGRFTVVAGPRGGTIAEAFIPTHPMP